MQTKRIQKAVQFSAQVSLVVLILMIFLVGTEPIAVGLFRPPIDKIVHSLVYGSMLLLAFLSFPNTGKPALFIAVLIIGALDEIHQMYLPGRDAGLADLTANIFGCIIIMLFIFFKDRR